VADELERLGLRYALSTTAVEQLRGLVNLLAHDPLAPTSIRDPGRVIEDHVADSLAALELEPVRRAARVADLGSGAGLPGLPLAIALPRAEFHLVESARRKCDFIDRAISECTVANARSVNARAEAWSDGLGRFDLVTARALAPLAVVAEYAAPLLTLGGTALFWRGRRDPEDETAGAVAAHELGLEVGEIVRVQPYPAAAHRHLHLMSKVTETPSRFPRRPGVAGKRPLGRAAGVAASGRAGSDRPRR
jgi:16S rRNA (guanine527-N7)-methyltransferase